MVKFVSRLPDLSAPLQDDRATFCDSITSSCGGDVETEPSSICDYKTCFKYEKGVCALSWWEPIKLLEEGSISDIHLVRRRDKFKKVKYKDKRDVMSLAKKHKPWDAITNAVNKLNGTHKPSEDYGEVYVLKSIMKDHIGDDFVLDEMRKEIHTMSQLNHPNICRLVEAYERRRHIYLVMEFCSGGNLSGRVPMTERKAAVVTKKILSAVHYMHSKGVAHRDIKLENIMVDGDGQIKLIDFGLATAYLSEDYKNMSDKCGTLYSMAPQVLEGSYDEKCDMWSIGVVTYILLSGEKPFWGPKTRMPWKERRNLMIDLILKCQYTPMMYRQWNDVSNVAKKFVKSLLQMNPEDRPTPKEALHSEWIVTVGDDREDEDLIFLDEAGKEQIEQFASFRYKLWRLLSTALTEGEIEGLQAYVESQDDDVDGFISVERLHKIFLDASESMDSLDKNQLEEVFDIASNMYKDTSMKINYVDLFVEALVGRGRNTVEQLAKSFDVLDTAGTRHVPAKDLRILVENTIPPDMLEDVWDDVKIDDNGMVNTSDVLTTVTKKYASRHKNSIRGSTRSHELKSI